MPRRTSTIARWLAIGLIAGACSDVGAQTSQRTGSSDRQSTAVTAAAQPPTTQPSTTIVELSAACSRTVRQPIDALRDRQQLHRLPVSDTFDIAACYAAIDMMNRGAWAPAFDLDPALCPGKESAYAVADTVQQVIEIAWVSDVLAGRYDAPVGVAVATAANSAGGLRSLAVLVFCR